MVERRHRHVVETGLTLLAQSNVPHRFWHFAFETAVYLINRMPSRTNSHTSPFEHLFKRKPDLSFLRVFGCQCYPHLRSYNTHKMDFRSTSCIFLGYSTAHHGYRCFDPITDRIYIARHVRFNELSFPFASTPLKIPVPSPESPYISSYPNPSMPFSDPMALSTCEAEFMAAATAACQMLWLRVVSLESRRQQPLAAVVAVVAEAVGQRLKVERSIPGQLQQQIPLAVPISREEVVGKRLCEILLLPSNLSCTEVVWFSDSQQQEKKVMVSSSYGRRYVQVVAEKNFGF
ncbi:hypothetical protein E3N88_21538 [Mikania micrantha]|uniref:Retroviral polymerase SH3-like domain-containing protein n=1 Tax=Mikania micrantha TaxID=192012 RepID=A0A5N6NMK4_9ASTR|nr:hypothetical protein E3N88_21538 [Mikania micrantha]